MSSDDSSRHADTPPADLGVLEALRVLRSGALTSERLVADVLDRIQARNGGAPSFDGAPDAINAWANLYPERAMDAARDADRRRAAGHNDPLGGLPVALKDIVGVAGLPLTASSRQLDARVATVDAAAWRALDAAGAVLIGHTHTHEFAAGGTTDQVGNPWDLARSAGGSSGGAAAAVASGMIAVAIGTDTAGSVRIPAALCGVSSFKGSFGQVSTDGVLPLATTLDHVGPIARSLEDCALVQSVLVGTSGGVDPWGIGAQPRADLRSDAFPVRLDGVRIALTDRPANVDIDVSPAVLEGLERSRDALEELGAEIVELEAPHDFDRDDFDAILVAEARAWHARFADTPERYRPSTREFIASGTEPLPVDRYLRAQSSRLEVTRSWATWFERHRIDAVLEPTTAVAAGLRGDGYDADRNIGGTDPLTCFTATWNATGFPVAAFPAGLDGGLPVGCSLIGGPRRDARVLGLGVALQRLVPPLPIARAVA